MAGGVSSSPAIRHAPQNFAQSQRGCSQAHAHGPLGCVERVRVEPLPAKLNDQDLQQQLARQDGLQRRVGEGMGEEYA